MEPPVATCPSCDKWPCECNGYFYNVGYTTEEESSYLAFRSTKLVSKEELGKVVAECMVETAMEYRNHEVCLVMPNFKAFVEAMRKRDFFPLEYDAEFSLFGWSDILNPERGWNRHREEEETEFLRGISERLRELGFKEKGDEEK